MLNADGRPWVDLLDSGIAGTAERLRPLQAERIRLVAQHVGAKVHRGAQRFGRTVGRERAVRGAAAAGLADCLHLETKNRRVNSCKGSMAVGGTWDFAVVSEPASIGRQLGEHRTFEREHAAARQGKGWPISAYRIRVY